MKENIKNKLILASMQKILHGLEEGIHIIQVMLRQNSTSSHYLKKIDIFSDTKNVNTWTLWKGFSDA